MFFLHGLVSLFGMVCFHYFTGIQGLFHFYGIHYRSYKMSDLSCTRNLTIALIYAIIFQIEVPCSLK